LFVGITRATQWVYFSTINDNRFMFLDRFRDLEQRQQATIKFSDDLLSASDNRDKDENEDEEDYSDLV